MSCIGKTITLGWSGAERLGLNCAYEEVRVEAVGHDWIVVRDSHGVPATADFYPNHGVEHMLKELQE